MLHDHESDLRDRDLVILERDLGGPVHGSEHRDLAFLDHELAMYWGCWVGSE